MKSDALVVGAGLSGLVAALRLAEGGLKTTLVAQGVGSTHLSPASIDVLGYAPELVESPARALPAFLAEHPEHPYARVAPEGIRQSVEWLRERAGALAYTGSLEENLLVPTAAGVPAPTAIVPASMAAGDLRSGGRFAFVGLRALKSFYPAYLAENLAQAKLPSGGGLEARAVRVSDPGREPDVGALDYARAFEDASFRRAVASELGVHLQPGEVVGFPAVLGLDRHAEVRRELEDALERPVFEVPGLPPSVPGIRLFRTLRAAFRRAGGRLVMGAMAVGASARDGSVTALSVRAAASRTTVYEARWFVLATGGFASGALHLDSYGEVRETVFGLPVAGVPPIEEPRFLPGVFDDHPMARAGLAVDERLRPLGPEGAAAFDNLFAAGAVLAGAEPWRERSGNGLALATGFAAASHILEDAS
ncbi:MAG TPA: glycerol-3-phosphate dehydrogenase subunit GlpB [Actinomycetota bacterium]|nr:glycerol-3-phosphate dehydrogenase subunit GlpB [Actinomycetota bacterium]